LVKWPGRRDVDTISEKRVARRAEVDYIERRYEVWTLGEKVGMVCRGDANRGSVERRSEV
jgi:hypothetical protein